MNNNITEDYCSFEVSKLLKEKGFTWNDFKPFSGVLVSGIPQTLDNKFPCYNDDGKEIRPDKYVETNKHYPRPTHALAIKWIRENFRIDITCPISTSGYHMYQLWKWLGDAKGWERLSGIYGFNSPEEATEVALLYTLKNLI